MEKNKVLIELAILDVVNKLIPAKPRALTFGQIYMKALADHANIPPIKECVVIVDDLVAEGLIISDRVLEDDPRFPYKQHLIRGLTDVGVAALKIYLTKAL